MNHKFWQGWNIMFAIWCTSDVLQAIHDGNRHSLIINVALVALGIWGAISERKQANL